MRATSVARNYAEALFELGEKSGRGVEYHGMIESIAAAVDASPRAQMVFASPKVTKDRKGELLAATVPGAPNEFKLYLKAVVRRGRTLLLGEIATQFGALLDVKFNRVRAGITLAREPNQALRQSITDALAKALGKEIVAGFAVDPEILGGAVVRVGDRVLDGSVRRKLAQLRRQLLTR